jgi:hypothetical protein
MTDLTELIDIHWPTWQVTNPHIKELILFDKHTIVFDGYFRLEEGVFPVHRIVYINGKWFLVKLLSKKVVEDTSKYGEYDEELGGRICLTPTELLELEIKLLGHITSVEELKKLEAKIIEKEDSIRKLNQELKEKREKDEYNEWRKVYLTAEERGEKEETNEKKKEGGEESTPHQ